MTKTDEDEMQEYQCLLLEGHDEAEARRLARAANDRINSRRLSGPTTGDTRNGHGSRPLISDYRDEFYLEATSIGVDSRTDEERLEDWDMADRARNLRRYLTPRQWQVLDLLYGISDGVPRTYAEAGEIMGMKKTGIESARKKAILVIKKKTGMMSEREKEVEAARLARRREHYRRTGK